MTKSIKSLKTSVKELHINNFDIVKSYSAIKEKYPNENFLFESVEGTNKTARYSFIGFDPIFSFKSKGNSIECDGIKQKTSDPFEFLRRKFYGFDAGIVNFLPFSGGMVGYFSYDIVRFFEKLPTLKKDNLDIPDAHFIIPFHLICFDHINKKVYLISHNSAKEFSFSKEIENLINTTKQQNENTLNISNIKSEMTKNEYENAVEKAKEYIRMGDIFQTVLSRRKEIKYEGNEFEIYQILRTVNPCPYMFYLNFDETKIIGSSPEMLVRLENNILTTRPLAGTRPRSQNPEEDEKLKLEMLLDEKERAEHIMLVDLHRNDMGRVSKWGTVRVDELMGVEKYSHVQHIVSNITSTLRKDMDCFNALKSCFPAGTVSGAPKIRAMEIIEELEKSRRGPYAGVVGYFDFSGNMDFAISIRTIFTKKNRAYIQAGAGIVADSIPEKEFYETENKMGAMIKALKGDSK